MTSPMPARTRMPLRVFRAAVAAVEPFAGTQGDTPPVVLVERRDSSVRLTTRDHSGQLAHVRLDVATQGDDFTMAIRTVELRRALAAFGPLRLGQASQVEIVQVGSSRARLSAQRITVQVPTEDASRYRDPWGELAKALGREAGTFDAVGLNPKSLVAFGKVTALLDLLGVSAGGLQVRAGATQLAPILVLGGDTFAGLIQPRRRRPSDDEHLALWRTRLGA